MRLSLGINSRSRSAVGLAPPGDGGGGAAPVLSNYVGATSAGTGGSGGTGFTLVRSNIGGVAVGDRLMVVYHLPNAAASPIVPTGWTLLSGLDLNASPKFVILTRIADLTATDNCLITSGGTKYIGGTMYAFNDAAVISSAVTKKLTHSGTVASSQQLATDAGTLAATFYMAASSTTLTYDSGGTSRYISNGQWWVSGLATQAMTEAGDSDVVNWTAGANVLPVTYCIGLAAA